MHAPIGALVDHPYQIALLGQQMMEKVRTKQLQQLEREAAKKAAIEQLQNVYEQQKLQQQQQQQQVDRELLI